MNYARKLFIESVNCFCERTNEEIADKVFNGELRIIKNVPESIFEHENFKAYIKKQKEEGFDVTARESKQNSNSYVVKISWDV